MQHLKLIKDRFFTTLVLYFLSSFILFYTYVGQLEEANSYMGMKPWSMSILGYIVFFIGLQFLALIVSRTSGNPSDFFKIFYGSITINSFLVLHSITGPLSAFELIFGVIILFLPIAVIYVMDAFLPLIRIKGRVKSEWIEFLLIILLLVVMVTSSLQPPMSAGFGLELSYDRRLEGREIYSAGSLLAYGLSMAMNGFAPYLAFRAGLRRRFLIFAVSFAASIYFYWLLGVKAPVLFVIAAFVMGFLVEQGKLKSFGDYFLIIITVLGLTVVLEWVLFDGYSLVADYFFRRLFAVQAEVLDYYLKFVLEEKPLIWSWLYGSMDPTFEVTYYIGELYFDNDQSNVNVNAFFLQLAAKGLIGYGSAMGFVSFVLILLDRLYKSSCNPSYIFLGFLYGLLIVEQAFTVAMVSSGVGVLFLMTIFEKSSRGCFLNVDYKSGIVRQG